MTAATRMSNDIAPFFTFATSANPSINFHVRFDSNGQIRIHKIYQRCVSCNVKRFTSEEMLNLKRGVDTYFCKECNKKILEIISKYERGPNSEIYSKVWDAYIYSRL